MEKSIEEKERKGVFKSRKFKLLIVGLVLSLLTIGISLCDCICDFAIVCEFNSS